MQTITTRRAIIGAALGVWAMCMVQLNKPESATSELHDVSTIAKEGSVPEMQAQSTSATSALPTHVDLGPFTERRRAGTILAGDDLKAALRNIINVHTLRKDASQGNLSAVALLLDIAELCSGGTQDLTGKYDFKACLKSFGVSDGREMDHVVLELVGQLANAGYSGAQLEYSQRVLILIEDGRLNSKNGLDADNVSRAQGYLVKLAEAGNAEGAFRLAQAYLKGSFGSRDVGLGIKYAQRAQLYDPIRFENVKQMLGVQFD